MIYYARIGVCDESIGSLEPFALRRSTLDCNAGADLEQLCEPAVLTERCLKSWSSDQDFFVPSKYQNYYNTVATKLCWCYNIVKCLGQKEVELIGRFLSF